MVPEEASSRFLTEWQSKLLKKQTYVFLATLVVCFPGCGSQKSGKPQTAPSSAKNKKLDPQIGKVAWKGGYFPWYTYDKNGNATPVMTAKAENGELVTKTGLNKKRKPESYLLLKMNRVTASLYSKGKRSVDIQAKQMTANQKEDSVIGTGGCTLHSLQEPPNTTLTADTFRWKTTGHTLIAEGHTHLEKLASPEQQKFVYKGDYLKYDMDDEKITFK